jgi:hypothetical protein
MPPLESLASRATLRDMMQCDGTDFFDQILYRWIQKRKSQVNERARVLELSPHHLEQVALILFT